MTYIWLAVAGATFLLCVYARWKLTNRIAKGIMQQERVVLPGRRSLYFLASITVTFVGISALYFAAITYVGAPIQLNCWLPAALIASLLVGAGTFAELRFATFEERDGGDRSRLE